MPTTTSGADAWLTTFADAMALRSVITTGNVLVLTGWVSDTEGRDAIILGDSIVGEQDWAMLGNRRRDERFRIGGIIWVKRAGKGDGVIRTVRAQAFALLAEVEAELRVDPTVSGRAKVSAIVRYECDQGADTSGRWAQIDFEISNWKDLPS